MFLKWKPSSGQDGDNIDTHNTWKWYDIDSSKLENLVDLNENYLTNSHESRGHGVEWGQNFHPISANFSRGRYERCPCWSLLSSFSHEFSIYMLHRSTPFTHFCCKKACGFILVACNACFLHMKFVFGEQLMFCEFLSICWIGSTPIVISSSNGK
jgi:hypothetical protein